jgi:hypothetical protein
MALIRRFELRASKIAVASLLLIGLSIFGCKPTPTTIYYFQPYQYYFEDIEVNAGDVIEGSVQVRDYVETIDLRFWVNNSASEKIYEGSCSIQDTRVEFSVDCSEAGNYQFYIWNAANSVLDAAVRYKVE